MWAVNFGMGLVLCVRSCGRGWLLGALLFCGSVAPLAGVDAYGDETKYRLEEPADDFRVFGVGIRLEVGGTVETAVDQSKSVPHSLLVKAGLTYRERRMVGPGGDSESLRSIRDYEQTQADIKVGDQQTPSSLPAALKLIVVQGRAEGPEISSLGGSLSANELDLLKTPGDSLVLASLLPRTEVAIGETWTPAAWAVQLLAGLEAIVKQDVTCKLVSVEGGKANIKVSGSVEGATLGAQSNLELDGQLVYHLADRAIESLELLQKERRTVGVVSPGLNVTAKVRLLRKPAQDAGRLADAAIIDRASQPASSQDLLLRYELPWGVALQHPRQWYVFNQSEKMAILRLMHEGSLVAQCNVAVAPQLKPGQHTSPEEFQADIKQSLKDQLKKIEKAEALPGSGGKYQYRVQVAGTAGQQAMNWIYYLVAAPTGQQVSFLFSVEPKQEELLTPTELGLVQSLAFPGVAAARSK